MQLEQTAVNGQSWRASQYMSLVGPRGVAIAPSDGSDLVGFDPWEAYWPAAKRTRSTRITYPPYLDLVELGAGFVRLGEARSDYEGAKLAIDFANKWGLLGILPTHALSIFLEPLKGSDGTISQQVFFRQGGEWNEQTEERPEMAGATWLVQDNASYSWQELKSIAPYFPGIDMTGELPKPNTAQFFHRYAEPLFDFWYTALHFAKAALALGEMEVMQSEAGHRARTWLSALSYSAAPAFVFTPKGRYIEEERTSAGLLASFALMFLWDRTYGRRVLRCQQCERYFVSDDLKAIYCSRSHRLTASSQRYRRNKLNKTTAS